MCLRECIREGILRCKTFSRATARVSMTAVVPGASEGERGRRRKHHSGALPLEMVDGRLETSPEPGMSWTHLLASANCQIN